MKSYDKTAEPTSLVISSLVFLVCLLLPLLTNAMDYQLEEQPTDQSIQEDVTGNSYPATNYPPDYSWPPRCGPRNCVARCVTCEYDLCRASGGSAKQCNEQKELCKQVCEEGIEECPFGDEFCDFR
ncbi:MAG: hypothetical protein V3U75_03215 [Methylococcaceae bacterium]